MSTPQSEDYSYHKEHQKIGFRYVIMDYRLMQVKGIAEMQVKSIAEYSKGSLLIRDHFYSNSDRTLNSCEQTLETLIRRIILRRLIRVWAICLCPTKRTLGLYGSNKLAFIVLLSKVV